MNDIYSQNGYKSNIQIDENATINLELIDPSYPRAQGKNGQWISGNSQEGEFIMVIRPFQELDEKGNVVSEGISDSYLKHVVSHEMAHGLGEGHINWDNSPVENTSENNDNLMNTLDNFPNLPNHPNNNRLLPGQQDRMLENIKKDVEQSELFEGITID